MKREVSGPLAAGVIVVLVVIAGYVLWKAAFAPPSNGKPSVMSAHMQARADAAQKNAEEERRILMQRQQQQPSAPSGGGQ